MSESTRFGEQGGLLSYGGYLHIDTLLRQQVLQSDPPAHDELLFITIHQVYELWFKMLLAELTDARDRMLAGDNRCDSATHGVADELGSPILLEQRRHEPCVREHAGLLATRARSAEEHRRMLVFEGFETTKRCRVPV